MQAAAQTADRAVPVSEAAAHTPENVWSYSKRLSTASVFYGPTPACSVPRTILDPRGAVKRMVDGVVVLAALYMAAVLPYAPFIARAVCE